MAASARNAKSAEGSASARTTADVSFAKSVEGARSARTAASAQGAMSLVGTASAHMGASNHCAMSVVVDSRHLAGASELLRFGCTSVLVLRTHPHTILGAHGFLPDPLCILEELGNFASPAHPGFDDALVKKIIHRILGIRILVIGLSRKNSTAQHGSCMHGRRPNCITQCIQIASRNVRWR